MYSHLWSSNSSSGDISGTHKRDPDGEIVTHLAKNLLSKLTQPPGTNFQWHQPILNTVGKCKIIIKYWLLLLIYDIN